MVSTEADSHHSLVTSSPDKLSRQAAAEKSRALGGGDRRGPNKPLLPGWPSRTGGLLQGVHPLTCETLLRWCYNRPSARSREPLPTCAAASSSWKIPVPASLARRS